MSASAQMKSISPVGTETLLTGDAAASAIRPRHPPEGGTNASRPSEPSEAAQASTNRTRLSSLAAVTSAPGQSFTTAASILPAPISGVWLPIIL